MIEPNSNSTRVKQNYQTFEDVLSKVGEFGRYQIFTVIVIQCATILWAGSYAFLSLALLEPNLKCIKSSNDSENEYTYPRDDDYCAVYYNCSKRDLVTSNPVFYSPVEEWLLICDQAYAQDFILGVYLGGRIIGSFVGGHLGDYVGRKKGFFVTQFFILISSVMSLASNQDWIPLAICQFLNGLMFGIIIVTSYALMFEYTSNKYSLLINASFQYSLGYMVVAAVGSITRDWRYYLIFVNLISAPLLLGYLLFLESPRYLVTKGRLHYAADVLTSLASERWNNTGVEVWPDELVNLPMDESSRLYTFVHLFSTKPLAIQSLLQMLSTFTCSIVTSIFIMCLNTAPPGPLWHFFLYGLLRLFVIPIMLTLDLRTNCGRKIQYLGSLGIVGVCFIIIIMMLLLGLGEYSVPVYAISLIATTISVSAYYMSVLHITAVVYPTVVRCTAFGTLHITDDVGTLLSQLRVTQSNDYWVGMPYAICLGFIVVNFVVALFLQKETKGKKLVDRLEDLKDM